MLRALTGIVCLSLIACGPPKAGEDDEGTGDDASSATAGTATVGHSSTPTGSGGGDEAPNPDPSTTTSGTETGEVPLPTTDAPVPTTDAPTTSPVGVDGVPLFEEDTSHTFIVTPNDLPPVDCDPWTENCPEGFKCMPFATPGSTTWNSLKCTPVAEDPVSPGNPCTVQGGPLSGVDDCKKHAMCWGVDESLQGECVAMCDGDSIDQFCKGQDIACLRANNHIIRVCLPSCDPLLVDCQPGQLCIPTIDDFACVDDDGGGGGPLFAGCDAGNSCDPGLVCADPKHAGACVSGEPGCCLRFCDLDQPVCPVGQACTEWFGEFGGPGKFADVGLCVDV